MQVIILFGTKDTTGDLQIMVMMLVAMKYLITDRQLKDVMVIS